MQQLERPGDSPARPALRRGRARRDRLVGIWLLTVAALVFALIAVGGATRLTGSGLSITEWEPILGAVPPLSDTQWQTAFENYRQIPQYHAVNAGMTLAAFKAIYAWEWTHRLLARLVGIVFAIPFLLFWVTGRLRRDQAAKFMALLALGGLQGVIGWYMVRSGLSDRVAVNPLWLALHLATGFVILGLSLWLGLGLVGGKHARAQRGRADRWLAAALVVLIFVQVILGALVAGTKAGLISDTWPGMNGALVPPGLGALGPWYRNLTENLTAIQFNHRMMAYAVALLAIAHAGLITVRDGRGQQSAQILALAVLGQIALGIATIVAHVPLALGLAHQAGAAALFGIAVWHLHRLTVELGTFETEHQPDVLHGRA